MHDKTEKFDVIFAARVIHIGHIGVMKNHLDNMFDFLSPGGQVIIETTSPWSQYYEPFWDQWVAECEDISQVDSFDLSENEMVAKGRTKSDVCLVTFSMA